MATLTIHSQMDGFLLVDAILDVDAQGMSGHTNFQCAPSFAALEAMAQLAALHVRYRIDFKRHAFLLKVIHVNGLMHNNLDGQLHLEARIESHSRDAWQYQVTALMEGINGMDGRLIIGVRDYYEYFQDHRLRCHYQKRFAALRSRPVDVGGDSVVSQKWRIE